MTSLREQLARRVWIAAAAVVLIAFVAYGVALAGEYVFDDYHSVAGNPVVHDVANIPTFWTDPSAFSRGIGRMYRPALLSSFALNCAVSPEAWSLKAGNVLLHATVAALLLGWLWRLSRNLRASVVVAALFAAHPLASESINLVSARSEVLAMVGMLVALHALLSWQRREGTLVPLLGAAVGAVLACGSKETGVMAAVVGGAQVLWLRHSRCDRARLARGVVGLVPVVAVVFAYLVARKLLLGDIAVPLTGRDGTDVVSGHSRDLTTQLATMGTLLPRCVLQGLVPWPLQVDPIVGYRTSFGSFAVVAGWLTMAALTWLAWRAGPSARLRRVGAVLAWTVALPWIVVPLNMPLAEHRLYGPLVGFAAIAVAVVPRASRWLRTLRVTPRQLAFAGGALLLAFVATSAQRSWLYRDERALWRDSLAHNPMSFRSWSGLGGSTYRHGDALGAVAPLAKAHELYPANYDTACLYAEVMVAVPDAAADPERATALTEDLAARSPGDPWVRTLQVQALLQRGRVRGDREAFLLAEERALSCLQIAEPKGYVFRLAALARRGLGDLEGALVHLDASLACGRDALEVRLDRATLLRDLGRKADAQRELLTAARAHPGHPAVMQALQELAAPAR
jgi:hypothetical protein